MRRREFITVLVGKVVSWSPAAGAQRSSRSRTLPPKSFGHQRLVRAFGIRMKITSGLFNAYLKCPMKCKLRSHQRTR